MLEAVSGISSVRAFCSVLGPLQTVQRADLWEDIIAFQAGTAVHVGVDNLNVVLHVGRKCDEVDLVKPCVLMNDGDSLAFIFEMVRKRGKNTRLRAHY